MKRRMFMFSIGGFIYNRLSRFFGWDTIVRYRDVVYYDICLLILFIAELFI